MEKLTSSDKELIASDGQQTEVSIFCSTHLKRKQFMLIGLLCLVGLLTLTAMFGIYAVFRFIQEDTTQPSINEVITYELEKAENFLRTKREVNEISKAFEEHDESLRNVIKRETDNGGIESFLDEKYHEINKNDASELESVENVVFLQKRSYDLKNSIRKLEKVIDDNEILVKSLIGTVDESGETAVLIAKDLDDVSDEIKTLDSDILNLIETIYLPDNSFHKRVRHKRETEMFSSDIDPIALKLFAPRLEEKKREKRLVQQKLVAVRDEFIRCKKAANVDDTAGCDEIYSKVMDRFREITKKFKEIEKIVEEMESFQPTEARSAEESDDNLRKKDKKKKKKDKKDKKSSEEESSDEKPSKTSEEATSKAPKREKPTKKHGHFSSNGTDHNQELPELSTVSPETHDAVEPQVTPEDHEHSTAAVVPELVTEAQHDAKGQDSETIEPPTTPPHSPESVSTEFPTTNEATNDEVHEGSTKPIVPLHFPDDHHAVVPHVFPSDASVTELPFEFPKDKNIEVKDLTDVDKERSMQRKMIEDSEFSNMFSEFELSAASNQGRNVLQATKKESESQNTNGHHEFPEVDIKPAPLDVPKSHHAWTVKWPRLNDGLDVSQENSDMGSQSVMHQRSFSDGDEETLKLPSVKDSMKQIFPASPDFSIKIMDEKEAESENLPEELLKLFPELSMEAQNSKTLAEGRMLKEKDLSEVFPRKSHFTVQVADANSEKSEKLPQEFLNGLPSLSQDLSEPKLSKQLSKPELLQIFPDKHHLTLQFGDDTKKDDKLLPEFLEGLPAIAEDFREVSSPELLNVFPEKPDLELQFTDNNVADDDTLSPEFISGLSGILEDLRPSELVKLDHSETIEACPAVALDDSVRSHPKFQEDLEDMHSNMKPFQSQPSLERRVSQKIERSQQRGPLEDVLDVVLDDAIILIEDTVEALDSGALDFLDPSLGNMKSSATSSKNSDIIGASGPFLNLCEQMAKQGKQAQPTPISQPQVFEPQPAFIPLTTFGGGQVHFPATAETMKGSAKVMMNPGFNLMPYPVCFNYPSFQRVPQQYYYQIPVTQPGGKVDNSNHDAIDPEFIRSGGYFMPTAGTHLRPMIVPVQPYMNQAVPSPQTAYREAGSEAQPVQPTYCTFIASNTENVPAHYSETTEQPQTKVFEQTETTSKTEGTPVDFERNMNEDRAKAFNIPTQFDIIYATYPNYMFALNQSSQHHHCDEGKISCFNSHQCIPKSSWCDSKVDCLDASDETACSCKARLDESRICDGFIDCPMGSDELGCFGCDNFQYSCYSSRREFEEKGGSSMLMCYSAIEKCDGFKNCLNAKDESECSMIVRSVGAMHSYAVSSSEGVLHRNFKGRWYPVCKNPERWAREACEMENGISNFRPLLSVKALQIPGPFLQPGNREDVAPEFTDACRLGRVDEDENSVIFVKCPPSQCGSSKTFESEPHVRSARSTQALDQPELESPRIVGGVGAKPMEFPFIVAIYKDGHFHCGGSILNENWIITAAHCTRTFERHYYEVWAGVLRRSSYSPSAQISRVSNIVRHADYDQSTMANDIALMKLQIPLTFNRWVRPICLPSMGKSSLGENWKFGPKPGTICTTLGWGAIREKGPDPDDLMVVDVPIMSKCKTLADQLSENVCAGETFGTRDACQGDSGGPLVCKSLSNPSELYLLGVVSHGEGCARANEPGVYTRVALHIDWISENTDPKKPLPLLEPHHRCPGHVCVWGGNKCLARSLKCDGIVDCLGGEDEIECSSNWLNLLLSSSEAFSETTTQANDEQSTMSFEATTESTTASSSTTTTESQSLDPNDGEESEDKKITKKDIKAESFHCKKMAQSINIDQRCDKIFDCEDGTDEVDCTCRENLKHAFSKLICDGHVDCADATDEEGCVKCNTTEFACPISKTCLPKELRCDTQSDCKYGEDELDCFALTDGHSVMLDINGRPFMFNKGVITQNIKSEWKILCDDDESFISKGGQVAEDVCEIIGFKSAKSWKVIEMISSKIHATPSDPDAIDIRKRMIAGKERVSNESCVTLEIECSSFQSHSATVHQIRDINIKMNSTNHSIADKIEINFVPVNSSDHSKLLVKPVKKPAKQELDQIHSLDWPWMVEIFADGDLVANGILVEKSWVLVERSILGGTEEPLHESHVVALLGNTNSHVNIEGPHEQISKVDCLQFVNGSNLMLLHLESPVDFNRHVLPSFLPIINESDPDDSCLAIALDNNKITKILKLKIIKDCGGVQGTICYQQNSSNMKCDTKTSHSTAAIVCRSKTSSWYPKAFHKLKTGFCDFLEPNFVTDIQSFNAYDQIRAVIDHPCEKCHHHAVGIKCPAHRCPLGKCLDDQNLCDGHFDCHDKSDERTDVCQKVPSVSRKCSPSEFRCQNGNCIDKTKFCNHFNDCGDKSDEPSECTCFSYLRATDSSKLCDGTRHCWDRTDENPNYCGSDCAEGTFKCGGSIFCIPQEMVCDNRADCPNGADEEFCHGIYKYDSVDGFGEVMQNSFGIWHTKCFPKAAPPTQEQLEYLCKQLGFGNVARAESRITNPAENERQSKDDVQVEFHSINATKVVFYSKFSAVKVNDDFTVHLRPSQPLATLVEWDKTDHKNCHRMDLKCVT